jgi:hypothetical protein
LKVTLHIQNQNESKTVEVGGELSIGRTPAAQLVLDDEGLSRVNTTVFIEDDEVLVTDEGSTNGTFINGERIAGPPRILRDGDRLKIGSHTEIRVSIDDGRSYAATPPIAELAVPPHENSTPIPAALAVHSASPPPEEKPPYILIAAIAMTVLIIIFGGVALLVVPRWDGNRNGGTTSKTPPPSASRIPVRVMDPLGGENEDDLDDLIASWETAEQELDVASVKDVTVMSTDADEAELNVPRAKLEEVKSRLLAGPPGAGIRHPDLKVPLELSVGFRNQTKKLQEMKAAGYAQPMDFADLAAKRLSRDLIEMPMATDSFYLDVGGSAQDIEFTSFQFATPKNIELPIQPPSEKYNALRKLADNFAGQRFDLNSPDDRREIRRRLLRMFQPRAKPILQRLAKAYSDRFRRPLRVTSLTRSMDYQILLNRGNANSFKVSGAGSLPPHTSGCAFDLARKHMSVEEQNFMMQMLAEMERAGELDALIEYGVNACFHIFIYHDGKAPK